QPLETDQAVEDGGTFEEGSFAQLKQRFSSGTLLLLGVSLVLFGIVVSFGFWLAVRTRKRRHLITKIKRATSYNELNRILREFLSLTLSGEATSKTLQELDAYARTKIADADIQFEAIALLSQLEAHVYGDSSDDSSQITAVKKRIISLVKSLE
ncbi:MAG: hypothetical protein KDD42_04980, partial [Bdellovibrionales bacterium]|nr:hypothetical protein [Bdellovibrionales bacterium]